MTRVCLDGANLRAGGGVTHLRELLGAGDPRDAGVSAVTVFAPRTTLDRLPDAPWLQKLSHPRLEGGLAERAWFQSVELGPLAARHGDVLFVPGGTSATRFRPRVLMCRNMLPFDTVERARFGLSRTRARLTALRALQARSFAQADGLIFLTEYARAAVTPVLASVPPAVAVIPHGVDPRFVMAPRPARALADCTADDPLRVVMVSQLSPYKHQDTVVEAVRRLRAEGMPVRLDLYGPGEHAGMRATVTQQIAAYDPAGRFLAWHGPVAFEAIHAVYQRAEVFVFASSCENMPNTLLEAMAAGVPVASADRGPMPEVLGDTGVYFNPEDPATLRTALRALALDPARREALAAAATARAQDYTWSRTAADTWAFVRRVAERHRGAEAACAAS